MFIYILNGIKILYSMGPRTVPWLAPPRHIAHCTTKSCCTATRVTVPQYSDVTASCAAIVYGCEDNTKMSCRLCGIHGPR